MLTTWLLCWTLVSTQERSSSLFISDDASSGQFSFTDGVLEMRQGQGFLRTPRFYSDFSLSFEFRPVTPDAEVGVVMRALVSQGQIFEPAYRLSLPQLLSGDVRNAIRGPRNAVTLVEEGRIQSAAPDAWQRLEVVARLNRITLTLNEVLVGTYNVDRFTGYLLLTSKKGGVQLRKVTVADLDPPFETPPSMSPLKQLPEGASRPRLEREVKPFYSIEALNVRKVTGVVWLEAVVLADGSVGSVRVTRPLDPDLDRAAVATVRRWLFKPGKLNGTAVPVLVEVEMTFSIGK